MSNIFKKTFSFIMVVIVFVSCPLCVNASEHGGGGGTNHNPDFITDAGTINVKDDGVVMYYIEYIISQIGAVIVDHDITKVMANDQTMKEYIAKGKFDANKKTVEFPKETVVYVKQQLEKYAKENEPYYIAKSFAFNTADYSNMMNHRNVYNTIKNLLQESQSGFIVCGFSSDGNIWFADIDRNFADLSFVKVRGNENLIGIYENDTWKRLSWKVYEVRLAPDDAEIKTAAEFKEKAFTTFNGTKWDYALTQEAEVLKSLDTRIFGSSTYSIYSWAPLLSMENRRIRVFNNFSDFQNYTLNKRKVYYTSNYYNYVPEDLSVSIDDLQKEIDDLSKVIDQLLDQISKDTDESEIEELLRQILEALKNQQGTGGGGTGGGDVNVDIDLSTTNRLLSKILAKVTQIFDKMTSLAGQTLDDVVASIEDLNKMLKRYLAEITGDLDDIKGQLEEMSEQEVEEKTDSFLSQLMDLFSEISEMAKGKFPFSIPSDMQFLIGRISGMSPESAALYSYDADTVSSLSLHTDYSLNSVSENDGTDHGGGGDSRPGEDTDPPGGGGASRPGGSGFISVEHGGGGVSREPVSSNNWAPVFTLPIVIERYGIEEYVIIDMSMFDPVSKMSRTLFLIMYIICLYNMTFKVMGLWGDLVG